jgi:hypothetical protein
MGFCVNRRNRNAAEVRYRLQTSLTIEVRRLDLTRVVYVEDHKAFTCAGLSSLGCGGSVIDGAD